MVYYELIYGLTTTLNSTQTSDIKLLCDNSKFLFMKNSLVSVSVCYIGCLESQWCILLIEGRLQGSAAVMSWQTASSSVDQCFSPQALFRRSEKWQVTIYSKPI